MNTSQTLFVNLLSSDKSLRDQAEATLKQLKETPIDQSLPVFKEGACSQDPKVSQMALISLKNTYLAVPGEVANLQPEHATLLTEFCLSLIDMSRDRSFLFRTADILAKVVNDSTLDLIFKKTVDWINDQKVETKEFGAYCLKELSENNKLPEQVKMTNANVFLEIFDCLLKHENNKIRTLGLQAIISFLSTVSEKELVLKYSVLSKPILEALIASLKQDQQASLEFLIGLNTFTELVPNFWVSSIDFLIEVLCQILSESVFNKNVMDSAATLIATLCKQLPATVRKNATFAKMYFLVLFNLLTDLDNKDNIDEWTKGDEEESEAKWFVGKFNIYLVTMHLGGEYVFGTAGQTINNLINSSVWLEVHCGITALASLINGECKFLLKNAGELASHFTKGLSHEHPRVRWASLLGFKNLFREMGLKLKNNVIEASLKSVLEAFGDSNRRVFCESIEAILEILRTLSHEKFDIDKSLSMIIPYADQLMGKLAEILQSNIESTDEELQGNLLSSISCLGVILDKEFSQYYQNVMPLLIQILSAPATAQKKELRASCITTIAALMGTLVSVPELKPDFIKIADLFIQIISQAKESDPEMTSILTSFGALSACLGAEFKPYLAQIFPLLENLATQKIEVKMEDFEASNLKEDDQNDDAQFHVNILGVGKKSLSVNTFSCQTKNISVEVLCEVNEFCRENFSEYLPKFLSIVKDNLGFAYSRKVRKNCFKACWKTVSYLKNDQQKSAEVASILIPAMLESFEKAIKSEYKFDDLRFMAKHLGKIAENTSKEVLSNYAEPIYKSFQSLLTKIEKIKNEIQQEIATSQDENDIEQLTSEKNVYNDIFRRVMTANNSFLKLFGSDLDNIVATYILPFFQRSFDRVSQVWDDVDEILYNMCFFIDLYEFGELNKLQHVELFYTKGMECKIEDEAVVQTIVYGFGEIAKNLPKDKCASILQNITSYISTVIFREDAFEDDKCEATDNAIGALGKIVYFQATGDRQTAKEFLSRLPLQYDLQEGNAVAKLFFEMIIAKNESIINQDLLGDVKSALERIQTFNMDEKFMESDVAEKMLEATMLLKSG